MKRALLHQTPAALRADDVCVSFRGTPVLNNLCVEGRPGEFIAILGPNGAGKTTMLRALAGLLDSAGSIEATGAALRSMPSRARARAIAYLPQGGTILWPMTVREIVALGRLPHGDANRSGGREAVDRALSECDLLDFQNRPVTELSGGERARVVLARTLAVNAPILLADEPTAFLDPAHQTSVMRLLALEAGRGRLVIAVLHDVALALRYATRIIGLSGGRMAVDASPEDFVEGGHLERLYGVRYEMAVMASGRLTPVAEA